MHQRQTLQHCSSPICGCQGRNFDCANLPRHCFWNKSCCLLLACCGKPSCEGLQVIAFEPHMLPDAFRATHAVKATVPCL